MGDLAPSLIRTTFASEVVNASLGVYEYKTDEELASVELFKDYPEALLRFASACCIMFMLVGIPGNLITIIALARCKKVIVVCIFLKFLYFCTYYILYVEKNRLKSGINIYHKNSVRNSFVILLRYRFYIF